MNIFMNSAAGTSLGLLTIGKRMSTPGIGLSAQSRYLTDQYLNRLNGAANGLFSATGGASLSIEGLQTQILALRAKAPNSSLSKNLRAQPDLLPSELQRRSEAEQARNERLGTDNGGTSASPLGRSVNTVI